MQKKVFNKLNNRPMDDRYSDCVAQLLEDGKTVDEICGAFPEYDEEIRKFCASRTADKSSKPVLADLGGQANSVQANATAAKQPKSGNPNFGLFDPIREAISNRRAFFAAAAVFLMLIVANAVWLAAHSGSKPLSQAANENNSPAANATSSKEAQNITPTEGDQSSSALPEPTGNVDDTVVEIDKFAGQEDSIIAAENDDAKLIPSDNAAIDNFSTIYSGGAFSCAAAQNIVASAKKNEIDRASTLAVAQAGRLNTIIGGRNSRDNNLEAERSQTDSLLQRDYDKMMLVAEGGVQKQGVSDFSAAVGAAISARRAAIDAAQTGFRDGLDRILTQRMVDVKKAADTFEGVVDPALNQAAADCKNGSDQSSVLSRFQNAASQALANFNSARLSIESQNGDALASERAAAIKNANDAFASTLQKAVQDFKALQF